MPTRFFLGRKAELAQLKDWFFPEGEGGGGHSLAAVSDFKVVALFGKTGAGKTQLALKYAVTHKDAYDFVFFLDATSSVVLHNEFAKLRDSLKISDIGGDPVMQMKQWLISQAPGRWLLIFDNANNLQEVMPVITPVARSGHIIITTQDTRVGSNEFVDNSLEVPMLSPEESQQLLFDRSGMESPKLDEVEVAKLLVEELGYLPLAINSAGTYISVRQKSVREYADLLQHHSREMLDHRPDASSYERSVLAALELNFQAIDTHPGASALFSLLVFLDRSEVTEPFLVRGVTPQHRWGLDGENTLVDPASRYVPAELMALINNGPAFDEAIEDLVSHSIISCEKRDGVGRCITIHPLYHKCGRLRMSREERQKHGSGALCFLAHASPSDEYSLEDRFVKTHPQIDKTLILVCYN